MFRVEGRRLGLNEKRCWRVVHICSDFGTQVIGRILQRCLLASSEKRDLWLEMKCLNVKSMNIVEMKSVQSKENSFASICQP
jgi:hypothetical protein